MKNILKKFLIILISSSIILSFSVNSNAVNDEDTNSYEGVEIDDSKVDSYQDGTNDDIEGISLNDEEMGFSIDELSDDEESNENENEEGVKRENFYAFKDEDITVDDEIYGDVYIITDKKVTINSYIEGNVFVIASELELSDGAELNSSIYCCANKINIHGDINGSVYSLVTDEFNSYEDSGMYRDVFLSAPNINLDGYIARDVYVEGENINLQDTSTINGNFNYSSTHTITIPENIVQKEINFSPINETTKSNLDIVYSIITYIIFTLIVFLVLKWLNSSLVNAKKFNYLYGILGAVLMPIAIIILLLLGITANIALLLLALYIPFILIAPARVLIKFAQLILSKISKDEAQQSTSKTCLFITALCIVYKLLQLIPFAGTLLFFILEIIGFGIIINTLVAGRKKINNNI